MVTQVQFRRGTTAQHALFTGANAELTVDTDKKVVVVHDGVTLGGNPLANISNPTFTTSITVANSSTFVANSTTLLIGTAVGISANGSKGTSGQALLSNATSVYWGAAGASLTANTTDTVTYYIPMANTSSGAWTNAVVDTGMTYVPSTDTFNVPNTVSLGSSILTGYVTKSTTLATDQTVDSWLKSTYRSAKYVIQVTDNNSTSYHIEEMILLYNGTTVDFTAYGQVYSNASLGVFSANSNTTHVFLNFAPTSTSTTVKGERTLFVQ